MKKTRDELWIDSISSSMLVTFSALFWWWIPSILIYILDLGDITNWIYSLKGYIISNLVLFFIFYSYYSDEIKKGEQFEKEQKVFEKKQIKKGLKKYEDKWLTASTYEKEIAIDTFLDKCKQENRYKGLFMGCKNCGFVWKIRKDYSLPIRCTACGSDNIKLDREKIYSDII